MDKTKVLFVDDDLAIGSLVVMSLQEAGYDTHFQSTTMGLNVVINDFKPNIIILDVEIGDANGLDTIPSIKAIAPNTPIIFVSSHADSDYIKRAISEGAVVYIKKPFEIEELMAYIDRETTDKANTTSVLEFGESALNPYDRTLHTGNPVKVFKLNNMEFKLLQLLVLNKNKIVERRHIVSQLFSVSASDHSINNLISKLRKYLAPDTQIAIETIHNVGYKLTEKIG
jgi:two-component system KDP operon response regulator KdpE